MIVVEGTGNLGVRSTVYIVIHRFYEDVLLRRLVTCLEVVLEAGGKLIAFGLDLLLAINHGLPSVHGLSVDGDVLGLTSSGHTGLNLGDSTGELSLVPVVL